MLTTRAVGNTLRRVLPDRRSNSLKMAAVAGVAQSAAVWTAERLGMRKRRTPYGKIAAGSLAAAALTVPLGIAVGRRLRRNGAAEPLNGNLAGTQAGV